MKTIFVLKVKSIKNLWISECSGKGHDVGRSPKLWKTRKGAEKALETIKEYSHIDSSLLTVIEIDESDLTTNGYVKKSLQ